MAGIRVKPEYTVDSLNRAHNTTGPAIRTRNLDTGEILPEYDLYYIHGVIFPTGLEVDISGNKLFKKALSFVITDPNKLTIQDIDEEDNIERR